MARLNDRQVEAEEDESLYTNASNPRHHVERASQHSLSPSPGASQSDKENRVGPSNTSLRKQKSVSMDMSERPTPESANRPQKKRKLADRDAPNATQSERARELQEAGNSRYYDPNQSMQERRAVRKEYRDLTRDLTDQRGEFLTPGSDGLLKTLQRQNELFSSVKQTSDATLDSRLLVSTADLSAKRTTQLAVGDDTTGIDLDDFVGKCINFMRRQPNDSSSTQRRRRGGAGIDSDEEAQDFDEGDAFNWEYLGTAACCPNNMRPPVPGFLLGPLSVQKRARKATQRRERLRRDPNEAVRPEQLKAQDLEKAESTNLSIICNKIRTCLGKNMKEREARADAMGTDEMSVDQLQDTLDECVIADDGGIPFFNFVLNPKSFGQSVENLFYVSFLIRDSLVRISRDSRSLPTLHTVDDEQIAAGKQSGGEAAQRHQAVFHLDYETWEGLIDAFNITESVIPHRESHTDAQQIGASGWYG